MNGGLLMRLRSAYVGVLLCVMAEAASGQVTTGPGDGRVLVVRQVSWWAADDLSSSEVIARDTTLIFRPDSVLGWPSTGIIPVEFQREPYRRVRSSLSLTDDGAVREVLVNAEEARCAETWSDPPTSSLVTFVLATITPAHPRDEEERVLPQLTFAACRDTIWTSLTRTLRRYRPDSAPGQSAFLTLDGSMDATWRIERHLSNTGTVVRTALQGRLNGRVRVTPQGVADSFNLSGGFRGFMTWAQPTGHTDTVYGIWRVRLEGGWREDLEPVRRRRFAYFVEHGRYREGDEPDDPSLNQFAELVTRAETDTDAADSLLMILRSTEDPEIRSDAEAALGALPPSRRTAFVTALLEAPTRAAPSLILNDLRYRWRSPDAPLGLPVARFLVREFAPLVVQRRRLTDRESLGADVLGTLSSERGFVAEAGPVLADAAERTDDPIGRNLLLLAAYQADPRRYRSLVEARADSVRGYGPIVRAWVMGSGTLMGQSYGTEAGWRQLVNRFPGVDAPADSLTLYLDNETNHGAGLAPLRMYFTSDGRDVRAAFATRFRADTTFATRAAVARYLERLGDTLARPWLRGLLVGDDEGRAIAYKLLPPDTVQDRQTVSELQSLLIGYIAGQSVPPDTTGAPVAEPWVHDERPDLRILISDGLEPSAISPWQDFFDVMSRDSVEARVAIDGLQMAWQVAPIERIGDRYYARVSLVPIGERCLCGGGVNLTLRRVRTRWVAIEVGRWIS